MLSQRFSLTGLAAAGLAALLWPSPAAAQYDRDRPSPMSVGRAYYESSGPGYSIYYPSAAYAGSYRFYPGYYTGDYRPSRFASGEGYYATVPPSYSPIFFTSLNYPGVYGSYGFGVASTTTNVAPTFQTARPNLPSDNPVGAPYAPLSRRLDEVPYQDRGEVATLTTRAGRPALIDVRLPEDATLTFQGIATEQAGAFRTFESPSLLPGRTYTYDVRARWKDDDGNEVERTRHLTVRAGDHLEIDLRRGARARAAEPENERPMLRTAPLPRMRNTPPASRE